MKRRRLVRVPASSANLGPGFDVLAAGINSQNVNKLETRFVKLNFSYKFGNQKVKASQRRESGVDAEKSRMDN